MTYPFVQAFHDLGKAKGPRLAFVVHMAEGGGTVGYLAKRNPNGVSVHYVIERSGRIVQMLREDHMHASINTRDIRTSDDPDGFYGKTARTAVMGTWGTINQGTSGPNHASIAVEIEGVAKDGPNADQTAALARLYRDLQSRHPGIRSLGHRDFADYKACPGRKVAWDLVGGHGTEGAAMPGLDLRPIPGSPITTIVVDVPKGTEVIYSTDRQRDKTTADATARLATGPWDPLEISGEQRGYEVVLAAGRAWIRESALTIRPDVAGDPTGDFNAGVDAAVAAAATARRA
jgi:hypothetical protein